MKCTEILIQEHDIILKELDKIEAHLGDLSCDKKPIMETFFTFVKEYVDEYHHSKEEQFYFKWMIVTQASADLDG